MKSDDKVLAVLREYIQKLEGVLYESAKVVPLINGDKMPGLRGEAYRFVGANLDSLKRYSYLAAEHSANNADKASWACRECFKINLSKYKICLFCDSPRDGVMQ